MSELEIRVSASTPSSALANSIVAAIKEGKEVSLSAIGPIPTSQAYKAVCTANRYLASEGVMLLIVPGLETKELFDKATEKVIPWVASKMRLRNAWDKK